MKAKFIYESLFIKKQGKDILHDFEYEYFGSDTLLTSSIKNNFEEGILSAIKDGAVISKDDIVNAIDNNNINTVKILLNNIDIKEDVSILRFASDKGRYKIVKLLLDNGAIITPECLIWSSYEGYYKVVKLLLDAGANVHTHSDTSLRSASKYGHYEVVKLLLDAGADVHAYNGEAITVAANNKIKNLLIQYE